MECILIAPIPRTESWILEEERPRIICIDELDKMPRTFQNQLLNIMESGRIKVDQQKKQYDFEIKGAKVLATCNELFARSCNISPGRNGRFWLMPPYFLLVCSSEPPAQHNEV